jgi:hypothetical protein
MMVIDRVVSVYMMPGILTVADRSANLQTARRNPWVWRRSAGRKEKRRRIAPAPPNLTNQPIY